MAEKVSKVTVCVKGQVSKLPGRFKEPGGSLATQELNVSRGAYGSHITEDFQALWIWKSLRGFPVSSEAA